MQNINSLVMGGESDREWVKDFGASDQSQNMYALAAWLDGLGLKLTTKSILNRHDE